MPAPTGFARGPPTTGLTHDAPLGWSSAQRKLATSAKSLACFQADRPANLHMLGPPVESWVRAHDDGMGGQAIPGARRGFAGAPNARALDRLPGKITSFGRRCAIAEDYARARWRTDAETRHVQ